MELRGVIHGKYLAHFLAHSNTQQITTIIITSNFKSLQKGNDLKESSAEKPESGSGSQDELEEVRRIVESRRSILGIKSCLQESRGTSEEGAGEVNESERLCKVYIHQNGMIHLSGVLYLFREF